MVLDYILIVSYLCHNIFLLFKCITSVPCFVLLTATKPWFNFSCCSRSYYTHNLSLVLYSVSIIHRICTVLTKQQHGNTATRDGNKIHHTTTPSWATWDGIVQQHHHEKTVTSTHTHFSKLLSSALYSFQGFDITNLKSDLYIFLLLPFGCSEILLPVQYYYLLLLLPSVVSYFVQLYEYGYKYVLEVLVCDWNTSTSTVRVHSIFVPYAHNFFSTVYMHVP
jgi:hypothetical protein